MSSQSENLADIVGMSAIIDPVANSIFSIVYWALLIIAVLLIIRFRKQHSINGQLKIIKQQLVKAQIAPRSAAHQIGTLIANKNCSESKIAQLKTLRFSATEPTAQHIIEFINHVV